MGCFFLVFQNAKVGKRIYFIKNLTFWGGEELKMGYGGGDGCDVVADEGEALAGFAKVDGAGMLLDVGDELCEEG